MKKRMAIWTIVIVVILGVIGLLNGKRFLENRDYSMLMNQIETKVYQNTEINEVLMEKVVTGIEKKQAQNKALKPLEQFFLGYKAYLDEDYEKAYAYYMPISRVEIAKNKELANLLINIHLNRMCISFDKNDEAVELTQYWIAQYKKQTLKKHERLVALAITELRANIENIDVMIACYEHVLEKYKEMNYHPDIYIPQYLASFYVERGQYGSGLEYHMQVLAECERKGNDLITIIEKYNLGILYNYLDNNNDAKEWLEKSIEHETELTSQIAYYKGMALCSYIDILLQLDAMEEVDAAIEKYQEMSSIMEEAYRLQIDSLFQLSMLRYYIKLEDREAARKQAENILAQGVTMESFTETDAMYQAALGEYYLFAGEDAKGIKLLEAVEISEMKHSSKLAIKTLLDYYMAKENHEKTNEYIIKLQACYDQETTYMNTSYADYANKKYAYEKALTEMNERRIRNYMIAFIGIICALVITGSLYFKLRLLISMNKLDGLTQVYNRGYFNKEYSQMKQKEECFALTIFDIDNFKKINDTYGHVYGDYVIKNIAQLTKQIIGKAGKVFRYGGEEFAIVLPKTNEEQATLYADKVRQAIESFKWDNGVLVTVSMGIACSLSNEENTIEIADEQLYEAKHTGKNRVCVA